MYPLVDATTMQARAEQRRRTGEAARLALCARSSGDPGHGRVLRHALGAGLVRAGLRLIEA